VGLGVDVVAVAVVAGVAAVVPLGVAAEEICAADAVVSVPEDFAVCVLLASGVAVDGTGFAPRGAGGLGANAPAISEPSPNF